MPNHIDLAENIVLEASEIMERHGVPVEDAARITEKLVKAGENAAWVAAAQSAEERGKSLGLDTRAYLEEADRFLGDAIERLAKCGVPKQVTQRIVQLLISAGEQTMKYKVSKA